MSWDRACSGLEPVSAGPRAAPGVVTASPGTSTIGSRRVTPRSAARADESRECEGVCICSRRDRLTMQMASPQDSTMANEHLAAGGWMPPSDVWLARARLDRVEPVTAESWATWMSFLRVLQRNSSTNSSGNCRRESCTVWMPIGSSRSSGSACATCRAPVRVRCLNSPSDWRGDGWNDCRSPARPRRGRWPGAADRPTRALRSRVNAPGADGEGRSVGPVSG
jgi:hypothetical protein